MVNLGLRDIRMGWKGKWTTCAAIRVLVFFTGVVVSAAAAHEYATKKATKHFDARLQKEIEALKEYYSSQSYRDSVKKDLIDEGYFDVGTDGETVDLDKAAESPPDLAAELKELKERILNNYHESIPEDQKKTLEEYGAEQVTSQVRAFEGVKDDYDPRNPRQEDYPDIFLIAPHDFHTVEEPWSHQQKQTATYYAEDDVLADHIQGVITDYADYVGSSFIDAFSGRGDDDYVYVRNSKTEIDYEIDYNEGSYSIEVLGFREEKQNVRKFRTED